MFRKTIIRIILLLLVLALGVLLLFTGKGHTLLLDNKAITLNGKEYAGLPEVMVVVDSLEPVRVAPGEREAVVVQGVQHTITLTVDGKQTVRRFSLPFGNTLLCSLPALQAGDAVWFEVYRVEAVKPAGDADEEIAGE